MSTISWTTVDPDTIERIIAVGLCRRHKRARRIKPSQGDGGLDILVPGPGGSQLQIEDYQVKKFADVLNDSRERQIERSLKRAIKTHNEQTFGYEIYRWHLTLPMDLTREQEKWLFGLADDLDCPFPVEVFGLTEIEELLLEAPDIREYYIGDGMDRLRELFVQMSNLNGLTDLRNLADDPLAVKPSDVTRALADLHHHLNAADPHFDYDFEVTNESPALTVVPGRIASVVGRDDPNDPYVTWHVSTKYDTALEDRSIPGGYTVYPDRMTPEQRTAWARWHMYGTPVELEGDVVGDVHVDLPGGMGGPLPEGDQMLRLGPAVGEFDGEPAGHALWVIEDADGASVAERLFTFRLKGRGLGGGEHRHGVDADGYLSVDLFARPGKDADRSLQLQLHAEGARWVGEPVQRIGPAIRFAAAWTRGNLLRPRDEFSLNVSPEAFPLRAESPIPMTAVEAVEDLIRISSATRRPLGLPGNIIALAQQRGAGLRIIADTVSGLEPLVGIAELVVLHEDDPAAFDDLVARTAAGTLVIPWDIPFDLLGEGFTFSFSLELMGEVTLEPVEPSESAAERGMRAVQLIPTERTRGRMRWAPDQAAGPSAS